MEKERYQDIILSSLVLTSMVKKINDDSYINNQNDYQKEIILMNLVISSLVEELKQKGMTIDEITNKFNK